MVRQTAASPPDLWSGRLLTGQLDPESPDGGAPRDTRTRFRGDAGTHRDAGAHHDVGAHSNGDRRTSTVPSTDAATDAAADPSADPRADSPTQRQPRLRHHPRVPARR